MYKGNCYSKSHSCYFSADVTSYIQHIRFAKLYLKVAGRLIYVEQFVLIINFAPNFYKHDASYEALMVIC